MAILQKTWQPCTLLAKCNNMYEFNTQIILKKTWPPCVALYLYNMTYEFNAKIII